MPTTHFLFFPSQSKPLRILLVCYYAVICFQVFSCKQAPPEPSKPPTLSLKAEDASCTEAWLKVSCTELPATIRLQILTPTTQTKQTIRLTTTDTLLIDEGLLPNRTYTYQLQKLASDSSVIETSASVQLTTMDTTSHNWHFEIDTLGVTASTLYDVAIISDSNVWAVGELFLNDTVTGHLDPILYNLATWNGHQWNIQRVLLPICPSGTGYAPLRAIFAFGENDIWMTDGGKMLHWNGQTFRGDCSMNHLLQGGLNKIWGYGSSIYAVGNAGTIIYSPNRGATWQRVESGTTVKLTDIWGTPNSFELWASGFDERIGASIVLRLENGTWHTVWDRLAPPRPPYIYTSYVSSVWSSGRGEFVAVGGRFYRNSLLNINIVRNEYIYRSDGSSYLFQLDNFAYRVRGSERNDVFLAGDDAMVWHWNGTTWLRYNHLINPDDRLYGLAATSTMVIAVGTRYSGIQRSALVLRGRR